MPNDQPADISLPSFAGLPEGPGGPLAGLTIIELGHFVAAPHCTRVLADLGARVIKVEPPVKGDPVRTWGEHVNGRSLWFSVHGRNKLCVTANLKSPDGIQLAKDLIAKADAVVENFKPGQLEKFGLGPKEIERLSPGCVFTRISGYGQTGPRAQMAAFGVIGESIGGLRHLTGFPKGMTDLPPARVGVSLGDMIAGLYAAVGMLAALYERGKVGPDAHKEGYMGRVVDAALTESVFSFLEGCLPEYGKLGKIREPYGSTLPTTAPSDAYMAKTGEWFLIGANSDPLFQKLANLMGQPDLPKDPRFVDNQSRVKHVSALDALIRAWAATQTIDELEQKVGGEDIPSGRVYTIEDCTRDSQYLERGMIRTVEDPHFGDVLHPGVVPMMTGGPKGSTGGGVAWAGPAVGAHNDIIYRGVLGRSTDELARLTQTGAI
ncbi:MAG: CoA transferase [Rhodospirillaceae bacterium]